MHAINTPPAPITSAALLLDGRPFERMDADEAGLSQHEVSTLVAAGALRQVIRGVHLDARVPDDLASRAACLRPRLPGTPSSPGSRRRGCGASTAVLPTSWGRYRSWSAWSRPVGSLSAVQGCAAMWRTWRQTPASSEESPPPTPSGPRSTSCGGFRRTWVSPSLTSLAAHGLVTPAGLVAHCGDFRASRGIRQARYLAGLVEPRTESFGESWLRLRIVDAGFPRPTAQVEVLDAAGRCVYRPDLGWEHRAVAVEYDGEQYHSTPDQVARDRRRREDLERTHGWRVLGVGRGEVLGASLALERAVGELLGLEPRIRRRRW